MAVTWGNPAVQANLDTQVANLAALAPTWHGPQTGVNIQQVFNQTNGGASAQPSNLDKFFSTVASIGKDSAHIIGGAATWVFKQGESMVKSAAEFVPSLAEETITSFHSLSVSRQQDELQSKYSNLVSLYKSGRVNDSEFNNEAKSLRQNYDSLSQQQLALEKRELSQNSQAIKNTVNTASAVVTILTAGVGGVLAKAATGNGEAAAADFLSSTAADSALKEGEGAISKLATNSKAFEQVAASRQSAVKQALTSVLANSSADMTSGQIARAATVNLLLNYPLTYNALSSSGQQVFQELQKGKYGNAVKSLAFNAAILMSGGAIGHALKYGGEVLKGISNVTFGRTSFLDTLSQGVSSGEADGLYKAITKAGGDTAKNWAVLEATNVAAEGGNATRAAYRIIDAWQAAGRPIGKMTYDDIVKEGNDWAAGQRMLTEHLISKGMSADQAAKYVVGRWTAADANNIALQVSKGITQDDRLQIWSDLKAGTPNASWANSRSLDDQITNIIKTTDSAETTSDKIRTIEAQFGIKGVSQSVSQRLSKMGLVAIEPVDLEAPFKEGGKLASKFANPEDEFFVKTTQPLPVLGSVGAVLTNMGLSPNAAEQRVYQLFNANLTGNLSKLDMSTKLIGSTPEENADFFAKKLADYARNKTLKIGGRETQLITDYRQMTLGDIKNALQGYIDTNAEAREVRSALMDAMLQVPLSVRGLGDRVMDVNYAVNPLAKGYAKLQNALRFAWNPFFQARVSYKAEFLSQLESGGKFPTLLGTNRILQAVFPEKYAQLDDISRTLESKGIFGAGYAAEGADEQTAGYKMLGHELLQGQKRSVAGLISVMADKVGLKPDEFVDAFPGETKDTVRMILQYDPRANFLNSPMARTLNFAFFPFRFNMKVTTIMARNLAKQPAVMQFAVIKGLMQAHQFLSSPEGQAWYTKNAAAIQLFQYFSPLETLSTISQIVSNPTSVGSFGSLGGLPFGWIPGLLDAEGITHFGTTYVNTQTGQPGVNYVPTNAAGGVLAAIQDFIGQLFTYPGAEVGLPSKTSLSYKLAKGLTPGNPTSVAVPQTLTPEQQKFQQTVQQAQGLRQQRTNISPQTPQGEPATMVPIRQTSLTTPVPRSVKSGRSAKKKKTQETPYLLPGQPSLGVIPGAQ